MTNLRAEPLELPHRCRLLALSQLITMKVCPGLFSFAPSQIVAPGRGLGIYPKMHYPSLYLPLLEQ